MVEFYYNVQSDNGSLTDDHALRRWSEMYLRAHDGSRDLRAPLRFQNLFEQAGFVDVETRMIPVHLSGWSRSKDSASALHFYQEYGSFTYRFSSLTILPL